MKNSTTAGNPSRHSHSLRVSADLYDYIVAARGRLGLPDIVSTITYALGKGIPRLEDAVKEGWSEPLDLCCAPFNGNGKCPISFNVNEELDDLIKSTRGFPVLCSKYQHESDLLRAAIVLGALRNPFGGAVDSNHLLPRAGPGWTCIPWMIKEVVPAGSRHNFYKTVDRNIYFNKIWLGCRSAGSYVHASFFVESERRRRTTDIGGEYTGKTKIMEVDFSLAPDDRLVWQITTSGDGEAAGLRAHLGIRASFMVKRHLPKTTR